MSEQPKQSTQTVQPVEIKLNNEIPIEQSIYEKEISQDEILDKEIDENLLWQYQQYEQLKLLEQQKLQEKQDQVIAEYQQLIEIPKSKSEIIRRIRNYAKLFEEQIITLKPMLDIERLKQLSDQELTELFAELKSEVQSNRNVNFVNSMIKNDIQTYESLLNIFVDANGLTEMVMKDEDLLLDIKELIFEYDQTFTSLDPKKRIILNLLRYTFLVVKKNQKNKLPELTKKIYVDQSDTEKYKDL